jgi:hypothetical protein
MLRAISTVSVKSIAFGLLLQLTSILTAQAGTYSGPSQTAHLIDPAIPSVSPLFQTWANNIDASRTHFAPRGSTTISNTGINSLGDLDATEITNSVQPGNLTVTFPKALRNGTGADFAVFENGFAFGSPNGLFAEFAYVEVSTDGTNFARFPSIFTNIAPVTGSGAFAGYDVSNVYNLAGKHASGFGTPFNLDDLTGDPLVLGNLIDLNNIQFVKLVDIPGNGSFKDSQNNPILDNWLTTGTGGFDFRLPVGQGIGAINIVPEPTAVMLLSLGTLLLMRLRRPVK